MFTIKLKTISRFSEFRTFSQRIITFLKLKKTLILMNCLCVMFDRRKAFNCMFLSCHVRVSE